MKSLPGIGYREKYYPPYGLKIAGISSVKLGDAPEGNLQNNYKYQGNFSEMDADIGWNDFALRNYDAQIGRFVQQDPFDQFASGYVGLGADPINGIDPSGGISINFGTIGAITGSIALDRLLVSAGGAAIGFGVDKLAGGNGWTGALVGAGVGLGATFVPPFSIENLVSLGKSVGPTILAHAASIADDMVTQKKILSSIDKITSTPPNLSLNLPNTPLKPDLTLAPQSILPPSSTPWMPIAASQLGKTEIPKGSNDGPDVRKYLNTVVGLKPGSAWCGAFVNWTLGRVGIQGLSGLDAARAFKYSNFGQRLSRPAYGAIVIMKYSHVAFVAGMNKDGRIVLLGGNQGDAVTLSPNSLHDVKSFQYPSGYTPDYNLPSYYIKGRSLNFNSAH